MKKFFTIALSFVLCSALLLSFVGCSQNESDSDSEAQVGIIYDVETDDDGNKYAIVDKYALSEDDAKKVSNNDYADIMVDLVVPATYTDDDGRTYPVKEVAASAFANQLTLKSITFGSSITEFGSACLAGCANLESVTVPFVGKTVDAVNDGKLFGYLFGTASSVGSSSVTMSYNATGSKSYYIPNALKTVTVTGDQLPAYAFYGLNLSKVVLSGNVTAIGDYAFYGMSKLTSYAIPATVRTIGNYAFAECANLASVDFSAATGLTAIGDHAFDGCDLLGYANDYVLSFPASVTKLGDKAFYNCGELKNVDLSTSNITALGEYAFYNCAKLSAVRLNENTALSLGVFGKCEKLEMYDVVNLDSATGTGIAFDLDKYVA